MSSGDLDKIHQENKIEVAEPVNEKELSVDEWIDYKVNAWNTMNCSEGDRKEIVIWLIKNVRDINKQLNKMEDKNG